MGNKDSKSKKAEEGRKEEEAVPKSSNKEPLGTEPSPPNADDEVRTKQVSDEQSEPPPKDIKVSDSSCPAQYCIL